MKNSQSFDRALAYLREGIGKKVWKEQEMLPPIRELSRSAHVSFGSMCAAIKVLASEAIVTVARPKGVYVGRFLFGSSKPSPGKWRKVRNRIERDIYENFFPRELPLPSCKELQARYGTTSQTLKKALASLVTEAILELQRKKYHIRELTAAAASSSLVVLRPYHDRFALSPRTLECLRLIERECHRSNLQVVMIDFSCESGGRISFVKDDVHLKEPLPQNRCLGFFIINPPSESGHFAGLLKAVSSHKIPVAIIALYYDEEKDIRYPGSVDFRFPVYKNRAIQQFSIAYSKTAARKTARYLLSQGHRNIAFLSLYHKNIWSINRCAGLIEAFNEAGIATSVFESTDSNYDSFWHLYESCRPSIEASWKRDAVPGINRCIKKQNVFTARTDVIQNVLSETHDQLLKSLCRNWQKELSGKLYERALDHKEITAWVCAHDTVALDALSFLRDRGIAIPRRISVLGFDDTEESFFANLTTYNFDIPRAISQMLAYILNPHARSFIASQTPVDIEGTIIERGTVAKIIPPK
jgi:DNA-binding FadR family transcriptional regulator